MPFRKSNIRYLLVLLLMPVILLQSQPGSYSAEMAAYHKAQDAYFSNPDKSPLTKEGLARFEGLSFFPVNEKYRVMATFVLTPDASTFKMPTTTDRVVDYKKYGEAHFELDGKKYVLSIYQNQQIKDNEKFKNQLFLPYKDLTNGVESYGGGRYIDLTIPGGDMIVIDFNKSYNPYCAYNSKYSCPIPPDENHLDVEIRAGVMNYDH